MAWSFTKWVAKRDSLRLDSMRGREVKIESTPPGVALWSALIPAMEEFATGTVVDIGSGRLPYQGRFAHVDRYVSLDITSRHGPTILGDIQRLPIRNGAINTVVCTQVLEHVPQPVQAINEISRVLALNGVAIISVPHLSHLHNEPNDYYRFTHHALKLLIEDSGLELISVKAAGGLLSFLGLIPTMIAQSFTYSLPIIGRLVRSSCQQFSRVIVWLDKTAATSNLYPLNYLVIARKPLAENRKGNGKPRRLINSRL